MRLSVELVPRTPRDFDRQLTELARIAHALVPAGFDTVNVPSAPRYGLDALSACAAIAERGWRGVPHLRSMDLPEEDDGLLRERIDELAVRELLVVAGDPPEQGAPRAPTSTPLRLLRALTNARSSPRCYAAFDPNRAPDARLLARLDAKLDAGAIGLFGQPAFDVDSMQRWQDVLARRLPASNVFWGAAPVLSERSMQWWQRTNAVAFPADFAPTIEDWAQRLPTIAAAARAMGGNLYVMPIRTPIDVALGPLLNATPLAASA